MARVFCLVYRFANNAESTHVWETIRDVLKDADDLNLSCYNMQLLSNQAWCVALVGRTPSPSRQQQLQQLCSQGQPVSLTETEIVKLTQKRLQGMQEGPWVVKRHKKPGEYI
jgi:hypothetical protein